MVTSVAHPARFSENVLDAMADLIAEFTDVWHELHVLDPFAGTGRVHQLEAQYEWPDGMKTYGVELEPEWAAMHDRTTVGDATRLPSRWTGKFDVVATSPCYGNRMADCHDARDDSKRRTYRHDLGRMPTPGSAATMQWGDDYRELHERAWRQVHRVLRPDGLFLLNVKDHVRKGARQNVSRWHRTTVLKLGFELIKTRRVNTPSMRYGENYEARIPFETIYAFRRTP